MGHPKSRTIYNKESRKYTAEQVAEWRKTMRENGWNANRFSIKTGIPYRTVVRTLLKDLHGELK